MLMNRLNLFRLALLLGVSLAVNSVRAEVPEWIWFDNQGAKPADNEIRYFRKSFIIEGKVSQATLSAAGDDEIMVYVNGRKVIDAGGWNQATFVDVAKDLRQGENVIAIRGKNATGDAAVIAMLEFDLGKRRKQFLLTDASWVSSATAGTNWFARNLDASSWTKSVSLGKLGVKPWGDIMTMPKATPAEQLTLLPGFKAELLHSSEPGEGSWISMAIDPKGRLIVSPQEGKNNLLRITLAKDGKIAKMEKIDLPIGSAMGMLYAFDSLYVNGAGPEGLGLYRLRDTNHDDKYNSVKLIKKIEGAAGEHGSHGIILGPDKHLYIISGNFTKVPTDISPDSQHKNYAEDQLLPRGQDGNGFGNDVKPPGGFVLRTDADGKKWELYTAGMRNTYDFAFSPQGEIFGFDSDMEWDWGMPWYRPIRICHLVSGGDYGFREGTGKWPKYYPDSLPSTVDVGIGSPTGVKFGTDSKFPEKYKQALYALDWSYGRIFAVHLTPSGASYDASFEPFVKGKPLNVTDIEFGKDGAMYFTTGGRGTQSGLYRVSYVGEKVKEPRKTREEVAMEKNAAAARALRHKLETFHGHTDAKAVDFAWPHLNSDDRFIRYAARIAIESQPVEQWKNRALSETKTNAAINALLALARVGGKETQTDLLKALARFPLDGLSEEQKLEKLRVIELSFIRQGKPDAAIAKMAIEKLSRQYPARSDALNHELCQLLIYLEAPDVVEKTLALLDAAKTQEEQIFYIFRLRTVKTGWTMEQHEHYFSWFNREHEGEPGEPTYHRGAGYYPWSKRSGYKPQHSPELLKWFTDADREYGDGSSFPKFMAYFRKDAVASLTDSERAELASLITEQKNQPKAAVVEHKFVKEWKMEDLLADLEKASKNRSFSKGKEAFAAAQCAQCHRFDNAGGAVGPELTAISSRFARKDILESILDPSKVVSEQYQNITFTKKDGDDVTGRILEENDSKIVVITNPLTQTKVEVLKADITKRAAAKLSPMPEGLVNVLTREEILDLLAYLESGGKQTAAAFEKK
ncbi:MAG: heme-binding protein [Pedosphaera sp.]|nr:heme-binding protein [Pedosphaera sp.]